MFYCSHSLPRPGCPLQPLHILIHTQLIPWLFKVWTSSTSPSLAIKTLPVKRRRTVFHTRFHFPARCQIGQPKDHRRAFVRLTVSAVGSQPLRLLVTSVGSGRVGSLIDPAKSSTVTAWLRVKPHLGGSHPEA